jgi:hypothetical protein
VRAAGPGSKVAGLTAPGAEVRGRGRGAIAGAGPEGGAAPESGAELAGGALATIRRTGIMAPIPVTKPKRRTTTPTVTAAMTVLRRSSLNRRRRRLSELP